MLTVLFVSFVTLVLEIPIFFFLKKYLFLAVLGLRCGGFSLVVASRGLALFMAVLGLLIMVASLVVEQGL